MQNHNVPPSVVQELIHFIMRFASHFLSHKEMHPSQRQGIHFDLTKRMRCDTLLPRGASFQSLLRLRGFLYSEPEWISKELLNSSPSNWVSDAQKCYQEKRNYKTVPLFSPQMINQEPKFKPPHTEPSAKPKPSKGWLSVLAMLPLSVLDHCPSYG